MVNSTCRTCSKRIMNREKIGKCSLCGLNTHISCLPDYRENDIEYINDVSTNWTCPACLESIFPFQFIADNTLVNLITDTYDFEYDIERLESLVYDPFESNIGDGAGVLDDVDPDQNYLNELRGRQIQNCKYYYSDVKVNELQEKIENIDISLLHLNIRSVPKNLDKLIPLIDQSQIKYNFVALTETWLRSENADVYGLEGYNHEYLTRDNRPGGGVSIFIKEEINYKVRDDLSVIEPDIEMLWVEIENKSINSTSNLLLGVVYRIPGTDPTLFNAKLNEVLTKINQEQKQCLHTGDYNLNLLNSSNHPPTNKFIDINFSHSLFPTITKPTRITSGSATLIDNIFVNSDNIENHLSGILLCDISDHFPVFYLKFGNKKSNRDDFRTSRPQNVLNKAKFSTEIGETDWSPVYSNNDTQKAYSRDPNCCTCTAIAKCLLIPPYTVLFGCVRLLIFRKFFVAILNSLMY